MMKRIGLLLMIIAALAFSGALSGQENINQTDARGMKQGYWIAKYENGNPRYEGYFTDNRPVGEFKRFYEDGSLSVVMNYLPEGDTVKTLFYHPNGFISGKGIYIRQQKEGIWQFYSQFIEDYLVCTEYYRANMKEGASIKYHWNGNLAEELIFESDIKVGEWKQYYTDGILALRGQYTNGKLNGIFEAFNVNGTPMISGTYLNDVRNGEWNFYDKEGVFSNKIIYHNGVPENNAELIMEETRLLDELEKKGGLIEDPAKTGIKW